MRVVLNQGSKLVDTEDRGELASLAHIENWDKRFIFRWYFA